MRLSCYVPSEIIPKSRVVHLADKHILKSHILSYPKITVSKNLRGVGVGGRYLAHGLISFEEKGEPKRNRTEVPLLTSLTPTARPNRSTKTVEAEHRL